MQLIITNDAKKIIENEEKHRGKQVAIEVAESQYRT